MLHTARVNVVSRDRPCRVDDVGAIRVGALAGTCARIRSVERRDGAVGSAHVAVTYTARVIVVSRNRPRRVETVGARALEGACARARSVENSEGAVATAQEAVAHIVGVTGQSRNRARRVDSPSEGALASGSVCACARGIEPDDSGLVIGLVLCG